MEKANAKRNKERSADNSNLEEKLAVIKGKYDQINNRAE
jgi:hypothetical protein